MVERTNNHFSSLTSQETLNNNGFTEQINNYLQIISHGETPETVFKNIWLDHYRGDTSLQTARTIVGGLYEKLPIEDQERLVELGEKLKTPMMLAIEIAEKQVAIEKAKAMIAREIKKEQPKQTIKEKSPSKSWAKHIRREKAEQRRRNPQRND